MSPSMFNWEVRFGAQAGMPVLLEQNGEERPTTMTTSSWLPESIGAGVEVHSDAGFGA